MEIAQKIRELLVKNLKDLPVGEISFVIEHPEVISFGDYSTNIALLLSKRLNKNPRVLAEEIKNEIEKNKPNWISKIEVAGPGFINFFLKDSFFVDNLKEILKKWDKYGKNDNLKKQKTVIEFTDPNPFKLFHIGHLMSNTIGESVSLIVEANGAEVKKACYQGDVGLHVAKTIWGIKNVLFATYPKETDSLEIKMKYLGDAYAVGSGAYVNSDLNRFVPEEVVKQIQDLNKKIYNRSDEDINKIYDAGKRWSLEYFELIYEKLGMEKRPNKKAFDFYFLESRTGEFGKKLVEENLQEHIFEKSNNAVVFRAEKYNSSLHTRVFINSEGLPTYEAKELGLAKIKYEEYNYDKSIVITGNEVNDYFKVLLQAMKIIFPELAEKTIHLSHGMLRLPTGKMSSRTGDIVTYESLFEEVKNKISNVVSDKNFDNSKKDEIIRDISIGAIKYSILRQASSKDIIFDLEESISFEGASGPYLQYTAIRSFSIIKKAETLGIKESLEKKPKEIGAVEKLLARYPEVVARAGEEYAPHYLATYLVQLAGEFNSYYAQNTIVDEKDEYSPYKVALAQSVGIVISNGLGLLGIKVPEKM